MKDSTKRRKMGSFHVDCEVANVRSLFQMANGKTITRSIGFAFLRAGEFFTVDEVVFGKPGDLALLGARTLEGLGARVDPQAKRLVASGPHLAALARV